MEGELSDIAGGVADAGTGAAVARAMEPAAGEGGAGTHGGTCLNCGTALVGAHCHACGQRGEVHRTLAAFFHDLLHGVLHFEGKTWRTIPLLVWQPGKLTREYIDGKRARYVSPIALFLFVVFLSFALFNALGGPPVGTRVKGAPNIETVEAELDSKIAQAEARRKTASGPALEAVDEELDELRADRRRFGKLTGETAIGTDEARTDAINGLIKHVRENPQLAIYKAQTSAYKYSWMLIPLSVPFVWLLFPFSRRFRGYDHTVFVTYSIAFMIALVAVASLVIWAGGGVLGAAVLLYAPVHMYRQLKGTYGLSRFGAAWRMLALSGFAWIAIILFAVAIAFLSGS